MSYSDVSGKHELKIFQHYGYFSSDRAAALVNTYHAMGKLSRWQIDYIFSYFS